MSENTTQNATPETPEDDPILWRHAKREALIARVKTPTVMRLPIHITSSTSTRNTLVLKMARTLKTA